MLGGRHAYERLSCLPNDLATLTWMEVDTQELSRGEEHRGMKRGSER
jgi:hypothetical protein